LRLEVAGQVGGTVSVAFSPDGSRLATSGNDGMVRLWSATIGTPIAALDGGSLWQVRVIFSADGRILAAAGSDNHIRVWDVDGIGEAGARKSPPRGPTPP